MTPCGNFGLVSSSTGIIFMYNMQSGIKRKAFDVGPCPPSIVDRLRVATTSKRKVEERCVTGLASDTLNRTVIASTLDGTLNVSTLLKARPLPDSHLPRSSLISIPQRWKRR